MSILIKNMEMPKKCSECLFWTIASCTATFQGEKSCPLVEVPEPHGRLIDANALADSFEPADFWNPEAVDNCSAAVRIVHSAPTVIPASEEEE